MIDIKDISGKTLFSIQENENTVFVEELMSSDYIRLSWHSDKGEPIPVSSYIEYDGEKYRLLETYTPQMENEAEYVYTPEFNSRVIAWGKQIVPVYTYDVDGTTVKTREMDWEFTGSPLDAMFMVKQAIKNETGEDWTVQLSDGLPATISISSQSSSIFSVLNNIADECETEWWADKKTNTLYLSKCVKGEPITLEVGKHVGVPSVTDNSEGYYTRFYAFGSTRNIEQESLEGGASVNKRLTLDPVKYPYGYKDIRPGLTQEEVFVKTLYYDDIYPSSTLTISDVRARLRYRVDNEGNRIKIGGTDEEPVYEQYAIWYFQIAGFSFNPDTIIEGKILSVSFESGQLAGRDFELEYHEKAETVKDGNDVTPFEVNAGDYEIIIDESTGSIIPGLSYIIPQDGDSVILFNIVMPEEYTKSAQNELEEELDKYIAKQEEDNKTYQTSSNPVYFYENKTDLGLGQPVTFVYGGISVSTRIQSVEKRLDLPCYQDIGLGNKVVKGVIQKLKDDVAYTNQQIDIIKAFNELSVSLTNAYANAQREMIEGFAAIKKLWSLKEDDEGNQYAYTKLPIVGAAGLTTFAGDEIKVDSIFKGLPIDTETLQWVDGVLTVVGGTGGASNWDKLEGKPSWITPEKPKYTWPEIEQKPSWITAEKPQYSYTEITGLVEELGKYVTLDTGQSITGMKDFKNGMKVSGILFKVINGVLTLDCSIAVTGGITQFAVNEVNPSTIMDGVVVDGTSIKKENGVLKVMNAGGGEAGSVKWANITDKPVTLAGYGVSASDVLSTLKTVDGSGSGLDADLLDGQHSTYYVINKRLSDNIDFNTVIRSGIYRLGTITGNSTNGPTSCEWGQMLVLYGGGDTISQIAFDFRNTYIQVRSGNPFNVSGKGSWKSWRYLAFKDDNVASATKLQTTRYIWGRPFNGEQNVTGALTSVTNITASGSISCNTITTTGSVTTGGNITISNGSSSRLTIWDSSAYLMQQSISDLGGYGLYLYGSNGTRIANKLVVDSNAYLKGNVGIGTISPSQKLDVNGDIHANGWLRTSGGAGWYSQTYGGGWYMTDSTWIRTYNNKSVYSGNGIFLTGTGSQYAYNVANLAEVGNCRFRSERLNRMSANYVRPIFGWLDAVSDGWVTSYIMGTYRPALSDWGRIYWGVFQYETNKTQKAYMELRGDTNTLYVAGNILSGGGITCYSSDQRAKTVIEQISLSLKQIANAPTIRFKWNDWKIKDDGKTHIGGIAQYMQKLLPETVLEADGALNMDYATTGYIFAVQTAKYLVKTDTEVERLKKRVKKLEKQLKQLGYEEANIMDD